MDLLNQLESNSTLSKCSKETYNKMSKGLMRTCVGLTGRATMQDVLSKGHWESVNAALYDIIMHPNKYQPILKKNVLNMKSLNLYYNTIKALIKHSSDKSLLPLKDSWDKYAQVTDALLRTESEDHVITDRQKKGMVKWTEVLKILASLEKGSIEHLLLNTYTAFTRRQRDYSSVKIYNDPKDKIDDNTCCYIHLNPQGNRKPYIHIGEGKTIKHYGVFENDLPEDLLSSIQLSLKRDPREYLFGNKSDNTFRQWCNTMLRKILKNDTITVNILRHSHAEYIDSMPGIKVSERRKEADKMGHSVMKQLEYNLGLAKSSSLSSRFKAMDKKEICYRRDPKTNKLVEGECIFISK